VVDDVERELNAALASDVGWLPNTLDFTPDPAQVDSKAANGKKDWPAMKALLQEQRAKFMEDAHIRLLEAGDNHAAVAKARKKSLDELPSWRSGLVGRIRCIQTVKLEGSVKKKRKLREPVSKSKATELAQRHTYFWGARLRGEEHLERMRVKLFFPMYGYGANTELPRNGWCDAAPLADPMKPCERCKGRQVVTAKGCNDMPPWLRQTAREVLTTPVERGLDCINQVVINGYLKRGAKLNGHFDSPHLFRRPIVSLRLLSACELSFGVFPCPSGVSKEDQNGRSDKPRLFAIPQPRGTLTRMEDFAARAVRHAILPTMEDGPTASIIFRQVHDELLTQSEEDRAWLRRNRIVRCEVCDGTSINS